MNISKVVSLLKNKTYLEVLSLNQNNLNIEFKPAVGYFEHFSENIYEITYHGGGKERCTGTHSVYIFDKNDKIISKPAKDLKIGDNLITFCGGIKNKNIAYKKKFKIPYKLGIKNVNKFVYLDENLGRIIGYYCAEGCIKSQNGRQVGVNFCFDRSEENYINDLSYRMKKCFNIKPTNADNRLYMSIPIAKFFAKMSPHNNAKLKNIPDFLWNTNDKIFKEFIEGYIRGDGHIRKEGTRKSGTRCITTTSICMAIDLIWMLRDRGIPCSISSRISKEHYKRDGSFIKKSKSYNIIIPASIFKNTNRTSACQRIPNIFKNKKIIRKRGSIIRSLRSDIWKEINRKNANILRESINGNLSRYENLLIDSNIGMSKIRNIRKIDHKEMVYDITVKDSSNFFGGKIPILLHNSGKDMTRDIQERLNMFTGTEGGFIQVKRIALNYDQIELYNPPPNPAKNTDSRFQSYYEKFGGECWELDALEPSVIVNLIQNTINEYTDQYEYEHQQNIENNHKDELRKFLEEK
jgi:intein/homing endonuclease